MIFVSVIRNFLALVWILLLLASTGAQAQLSIEITGGGANQIPIGVLRFAGEQVLAQNISDIVEADLQRSGRFRMLFAGNVNPLPAEVAQVDFGAWKSRNASRASPHWPVQKAMLLPIASVFG